jgi:hypothetical protein
LFNLGSFIPAAIVFIVFAILTALIKYRNWRTMAKKRKPPFSGNLLRGPGESLRLELLSLQDKIIENLTLSVTIPLLLYSLVISMLYFNEGKVGVGTIIISAAICLGYEWYIIRELFKALNLRSTYQLGYEGEIAVGQELNMLMKDGYNVYHDFQTDRFNIDHIVIGPAGVFAVETKARSKPSSDDAVKDAKVTHDGHQLRFPAWNESKPVEQAKIQAKWLNRWLTKAVGQPVPVTPVLTLPGWYVERKKQGGIPIINPKQFGALLKPKSGNILDEEMISRITHQIDQKCRNVEPTPNP